MKTVFQFWAILGFILIISCKGKIEENQITKHDTLVYLKNTVASVSFSRWGGALVDFHLDNDSVNPFTWRMSIAEMPENNKNGAPFQGHFLCTGRWGSPTSGEILSGIPHNGEPSNILWKVKVKSDQSVQMECNAKLEGFEVERNVTMAKETSLFEVTEVFSNKLNIARNLPIVQHATVAAPFLDTMVVLQSNATKGFNQKFVPQKYLEYESYWPFLKTDTLGKVLDLRRSNHQEGFVGTFIFSDSIAWVTAYNPKDKLLLGYVWKTKDYPWLHIWHGTNDGKLIAKGLEFGTTGLGDTSPLDQRFLLNFYGVTNFNYIDANASVKKKYICFLFKFDEEIGSIKNIFFTSDKLIVKLITMDKENIKIFNLL